MTRRQAIALLAVVGILLALYLTLYKVGVIGVLSCSIGSCETVNTSKWSMLLGIPIAAWGIAAYVVMFVLAIVGASPAREESVTLSRLLVGFAGWNVCFSAWLTYLELFVIRAICIWCLSSALLWVVLLAVSVADLRATSRAAQTAARDS